VNDWERCRGWIEAALTTCPTHNIDDVQTGISTGHFQFWPGERCAAVTEVNDYPRVRMLHFWLLGGDLKELLTMRPMIEDWGRRVGCKAVTGEGRDAWGRVLIKHGYRRGPSEFAKDLT